MIGTIVFKRKYRIVEDLDWPEHFHTRLRGGEKVKVLEVNPHDNSILVRPTKKLVRMATGVQWVYLSALEEID